MADFEQSRFQGWAHLELFGRDEIAGYVTTLTFGTAVMFHIVLPKGLYWTWTLEQQDYFQGEYWDPGTVVRCPVRSIDTYVSPGSIFRLTPVTKERVEEIMAVSAATKWEIVSRAPDQNTKIQKDGRERAFALKPSEPYDSVEMEAVEFIEPPF